MNLGVLLVPAALIVAAISARSQDVPELIPYCPEIISVYVDGGTGIDPGFAAVMATPTSYTNNPSKPFQTIQAAIDACQYLVSLHYATYPAAQGVVYVMPGVYGPTARQGLTGGAVDVLPIHMRDRVNVQGQGMRSTTIRGAGTDPSSPAVFWPDNPCCGQVSDHEVLVDFSSENVHSGSGVGYPVPDWATVLNPVNSEEMLDRIGLQGGDVQVLNDSENVNLGRVSNCLFDMRHQVPLPHLPEESAIVVAGPYIGILITHLWDNHIEGYNNIPMKIFNNTFIFAETFGDEEELEPIYSSRNDAIGIVDVNRPMCQSLCVQGPSGDSDLRLRGVGSP